MAKKLQPPTTAAKVICGLYWFGLVFWISAIISAAVAAMNVFPTLKSLNEDGLQVAQYAAYPSEDHWRFAAGRIMEGVFFIGDLMQFVAAPIVVVTLLLQFGPVRMKLRRWSNVIRLIVLLIAAGLFGYYATRLAPPMNALLREQWSYAEAGEIEKADAVRATFDDLHGRANLILWVNLGLLLVGTGASAAAFAPGTWQKVPETEGLEEPRLAQPGEKPS